MRNDREGRMKDETKYGSCSAEWGMMLSMDMESVQGKEDLERNMTGSLISGCCSGLSKQLDNQLEMWMAK